MSRVVHEIELDGRFFVVECFDGINEWEGCWWRHIDLVEQIFRENQRPQEIAIGHSDGCIEPNEAGDFDEDRAREFVQSILSLHRPKKPKTPCELEDQLMQLIEEAKCSD